jgi:hypothetical protein
MPPFVEIFAPERRGSDWAVAAKVNLSGGSIRVVATAPDAIVAKALAKLSTYGAFRSSGAANVGATAKPRISAEAFQKASWNAVSPQPSPATDAGSWANGPGASRFRQFQSKIKATLPYTGPALDLLLDPATLTSAVAAATKGATPESIAAKATNAETGAKAAVAVQAAQAALSATGGNPDAADAMLQSLALALELLGQAIEGLDTATEQVSNIAARATEGDVLGEEALAYLSSLYGYYCEPAPEGWEGPDYTTEDDPDIDAGFADFEYFEDAEPSEEGLGDWGGRYYEVQEGYALDDGEIEPQSYTVGAMPKDTDRIARLLDVLATRSYGTRV